MQEQLFFGRYLLELTVVGDDFGFFFVCEPVAFVIGQCFHRLCIQLFVVDRLYIIDGVCDFDANETSATGRVGQDIEVVACCDECGVTSQIPVGRLVGQPCADVRFLQDMLQVTLVRILDGIELVYVYQGIAVQS